MAGWLETAGGVATASKAPLPPPGPRQPTERLRWYRRGWVIGLIALIVADGLGVVVAGAGKTNVSTVTALAQTAAAPIPTNQLI